MKLNIANPATAAQICLDIEDESILSAFYDKRMSQVVDGECLGPNYKGYVLRISGGNDKQGFPMKQGVLLQKRVKLLLRKGQSCYRSRRAGEMKRKSVRGCIVGPDLAVLNLVVEKQGDQHIEGLTTEESARGMRLGPKRASKLRKLFELTKQDDVRKYVIRRKIVKGDKTTEKAPKIQRLVTPLTLQRKRRRKALKLQQRTKVMNDRVEYERLHKKRVAERKASSRARKSSRKRSRVSGN